MDEMNTARPHTIIGLKKTTKWRLDKGRAPGQCYDGFLCQMMDLWEARNESPRITRNIPKKSYKEVRA